MESKELTPMMKQYYEIKKKYPNYLLFFRVGDFFELFDNDAKIASKELNIALTTRDKKHLMAGIPHHSLYNYIKKLIDKGYSIVICDQVEEPDKSKKLVKREIIRIITPGTLIEEELLSKENNYLLSIYYNKEEDKYYLAFADISTGEFLITSVSNKEELIAEIMKYNPVECLINENSVNTDELKKLIPVIKQLDSKYYNIEKNLNIIKKDIINFECISLNIDEITNICAIIKYIKENLILNNLKINIQKYEGNNYMLLSTTTLKNLELFKNIIDGTERGTLFEHLNKTKTSLGGRLLKKWIQRPLIKPEEIEKRLKGVDELYKKSYIRSEIRKILEKIYDLERIVSRIEYNKITPKELISLKESLKAIEEIKRYVFVSEKLDEIIKSINDTKEIHELIEKAIDENPSNNLKDGGIIKKGYCKELDNLRKLKENQQKYIEEIENKEKEKTGIQKLKVKYNSVLGYYIEVPKSKANLVPKYYKRKQTLVNYERYTFSDLEELENKILSCEERIKELEYNLFIELREKIKEKNLIIRKNANLISELDVLSTFAEISVLYNYKYPKISNSYDIIIKNGRHPTVEKYCEFVPNDVILSEENRLLLITGPNMAGKSTYLRMVGLITIMAQIGCFVPADYALIGVIDKIFTRLGTNDDITRGYSSFMVELNEINQILEQATSKSLVILDELGKSTESKEGTSLAWAICEELYNKKTKTLFATHFHDLTKLESKYKGIKNYHFEIIEENGNIKFDRKIKIGSNKQTYGIKIAKKVLPKKVIERAKEIFSEMYEKDISFIISEIESLDTNNLTPIDALIILNKMVKKCKTKKK